MQSHLLILAFGAYDFGVIAKKSLSRPMLRSFLSMFSSRNFMLSGLTFKSLINFELTFVEWYKKGVQFHFHACVSPVFPAPFSYLFFSFKVWLFYYFYFYWSIAVQYYISYMYSIVIHNFKSYIPFIVIIKHCLYFLCCTIYPCIPTPFTEEIILSLLGILDKY